MLRPRHDHAVPLLQDLLADSAARRPEHVALVTDRGRMRYDEVDRDSTALAWTFFRRGILPGDRVLVLGDNDAPSCIAFWAALKANAIPVVVSPQTRERKLAYLLADCRPTAFVAPSRLLPACERPVRESPHVRMTVVSGDVVDRDLAATRAAVTWDEACAGEVGSDAPPARHRIDGDIASIIYTSGSTGEPKGVVQTHRSMRAAAASIGAYLENTRDEVIFSALPLAFDYGLYQMILAFAAGARLVLERSFAFPADALRKMAHEGATAFPGVPTMFAMLDGLTPGEHGDLGAVRYVTNTAAALARKHVDVITRLFPAARVYAMYGLTECKRVSYVPPEDVDRKPGSVGIAIPNTEVWVANDAGERVPTGTIGEVRVRGATVMAGYWEKPEATAAVLVPGPVPGERVLRTGDYAVTDADGYLYLLGRGDDVIKCRGEKVAPREVEEALLDIPGVREAAVVGAADPMLGQVPMAYVVLSPGASLEPGAIVHECRARLEPHMVPVEVVILAALPKTFTGKVKTRELAALKVSEKEVIRVVD